ncbi:MAG: hypothetical protein HRJ53_30265 [Acidobacteria bacterium Pan2503]|uniref:Uncharacterized protein n=1 Tax=Candidatus Acidiferrum panamense TaxID=2741543 RepID=A0A7V8T121_9BACT|nr:hypothetical protein [Candidatus Acidoferrum panamensis]
MPAPLGPISGLASQSLTGNESWVVSVGGPQGTPGFYVTAAQFRNSTGVLTTAVTSGTITTTTTIGALIFTAAAAGVTVNLPPTPFDGQIFEVVNGTAASAFTGTNIVAVTDGSTIVGNSIGTLAAGASKEWRYVLATNTWYAMR